MPEGLPVRSPCWAKEAIAENEAVTLLVDNDVAVENIRRQAATAA